VRITISGDAGAITQRLKSFGIIHRGIQIVNGARADDHQKTAVFTIQDFFNTTAGGRDMFRNACGNRVPHRQFSRGNQAINTRSAEFVGFIHGISQKIFASSADYREVMGITLNQSLLISSSGRSRPDDVQNDTLIWINVLAY
jgi:hypothetical protein